MQRAQCQPGGVAADGDHYLEVSTWRYRGSLLVDEDEHMPPSGRRRRQKTDRTARISTRDGLLELDAQYLEILGLLDRATVARRTIAAVPRLTGVDLAWLGEPIAEDQM